jgi:sulfate adenylyltransferase
MIKEVAGYIEVYVSTPVNVCENRDRKGLYKKAREGAIKQFTGVSDPYEEPTSAEITINTAALSPEASIDLLIKQIKLLGYLQ